MLAWWNKRATITFTIGMAVFLSVFAAPPMFWAIGKVTGPVNHFIQAWWDWWLK